MRIRNELFAKFMQICMDRTRWLRVRRSEEIGRLAYSYVINIHELQPSRSVLLPLLCISSVRFFARFPTISAQFLREGEILSRRRARLHVESPQ